ncbi:integrase [Paenibacillus sp. D9]|uniref:tyrosine-type recombinase/integrase n=1 Tax=Paenibacillus sp. D9 TaxID=665792 RepID=UPI00061EF9BE|nr:tyrosine-type recombinase/integrase [Paenibacillus sp. D9]KKC45854.1 integrase [Paenibacillus sp. D9]
MASFKKYPANNKQGYKWGCIKEGPPDPVTGKRKQIERRGDTKKEAEARCDEAISKLTEFGIDEKKLKSLTFERVAEEWLDVYSRTGKKPGTLRLRRNSIKTLNSYIGQMSIDRIAPRDHQRILNKLHDEEYAKPTIEGVHVTANLIYQHAVKERYRRDNPAKGAVIPVRRRTVEEIESNPIEEKYLERAELNTLLDAAVKHGLELDQEILFLMAFSGMRMGEVLALKWSDINFDTGFVRVTKTLYSETNNMRVYELLPPKTNASIREFDVDAKILAMLKAHKKRQAAVKLATRHLIEDYHDENFVFRHDNGYPWAPKQLANRLERLVRKAGIAKKATSHIFRHTHVSMLSEAEIPLSTIMQRVGHDDPDTTLKIYTHVTEKMKKDASQKVSASFADILSGLALPKM